jgi:hypothetical protein
VLGRIGRAQTVWVWSDITSGAGTDSVGWTFPWATDSLTSGENLVCMVPLEMDAAGTSNTGLGTPFAGNMEIYPVYRTWGAGVAEPASSSNPLRLSGPTIVRGALRIEDRGRKTENRPELLDAAGRKVTSLVYGANDVSRLSPGVYFVHSTMDNRQSRMAKVVVTR